MFFGEQVQVRLQFLIEIIVELPPAKQSLYAREEFGQHRSSLRLLRRQAQQTPDDAGDAPPVLRFSGEVSAAGSRNRVELGLSVVLGSSTPGLNPTFLHKTDEAEVDRALVYLQR